MTAEPGTLDQLASALTAVFAPLREAIEDERTLELIAELGIAFPESLANDPSFANALASAVGIAQQFPADVAALVVAVADEDTGEIISLVAKILAAVKDLVVDIDTIASAIDAKKATFPGLTPAEVGAFASALPGRLFDYLVIRQVEDGLPPLAAGLDFIGVFERTRENQGSANPLKPPFTKRRLNLAGITDFLKKPGDVLKAKYGWGTAGFDGRDLLRTVERLALELGLPAVFTDGPTPSLDVMFLEIVPKTDVSPPGLVLRLASPLKAGGSFSRAGEKWAFDFTAAFSAAVGAELAILPDGTVSLKPPTATQLEGEVTASFGTKLPSGATSFVLLGEAGKSRIEFREFRIPARTKLVWNPGAGAAQGEFDIGAEIKGGKVVIDLSSVDGFLGDILSAIDLSADFDIAMGVSSTEGFYFRGSAGLEVRLPIHLDLAVVELQALTIGVGIRPEGFPISLGADIKASLGPLVAVVENMGMKATFAFADDNEGNLGPVDLGFGFKPPNGVGLSIDVAVVKGGGYLFFDFDKEEYAGALELSIAEIVTVKAIGLITTRLPDGSKGFSLLIIISAEFQGIQLGFGFTLNGVGGLLGVNRTMVLEALAEGVRTGAVESVLFPDDIIANAPRIISDLKQFFPPQAGVFLIGPMAKLGWGTPTLVSLSLGIIIEIPPGNIAILGVLKVALPDEDAALLVLQVNFVGAIEFDKKRIWFFAGLFDSRVLFITIAGEMGLLVAWGDDANFVVSIGGFHPAFNPPPMPFPSPKRICISILDESFARIRVSGYFAVTSNTVQFGASVEVFFGVDEFNIDGHLGFDALFQFSPFYFVITISASLSVTVFGIGLFSVGMRGELSGPTPWHIEGEGSITLLFFSIDVPFSHTWGDDAQTTLPPIEVMPLLEAEIAKLDNWRASVPASNKLLVALREVDATQELVLHPVGTLEMRQRAVPLDLKLEKFGSQKPSDVERFSLVVNDAALAKKADKREKFATAQFRKVSDADKLKLPAFEPQNAGLEFSVSGQQTRSDRVVRRVVRYEVSIVDSNFKRFVRRFVGVLASVFGFFLNGNAASLSALSKRTKQQRLPVDKKVLVKDPGFVIASTVDNAPAAAAPVFASKVQADDHLRDMLRADPSLHDGLHVLPSTEIKGAA